ncbi:filament-like plant protein 7 [Carica papaya]|uniref:filament-like plant protein 7 n=1 Tax=Carica papaya TaxID=3649 RepID=UPI000B8CFAB1|nr:filament-like plant protein 7 [Carica papaya]
MDHKGWLWRKKSTEKTTVLTEKADLSLKENEEEIQMLLAEKAEMENNLKNLNHRLSSALSECNAKDRLLQKHENTAQEAISGWKKADAEALTLKQELNEALQQKASFAEKSSALDAALKECMQQLKFVRQEQEKRIHDAVMKTSKEYEDAQMILQEKLAETGERLAKIGVENTKLSKALLMKENLVEDLNKQRNQLETDFNALMTRLRSTEKQNVSLKYEVQVLEKEVEIRNEEREFNRRTSDASHKQHLESVKKIAKLESECQRLRLLVQKRLPGPAALAKMKNEVEILGRDSLEMRRKKLNASPTGLILDSEVDNQHDTHGKRINILTEKLSAMEEENKTLKESLDKKINELQFSRIMYAQTASKLSEAESQLEEPSKGQMTVEQIKSTAISHELSMASVSDIGSDDKVSSAESWASALISELEHFRNAKHKGSPSPKTVEVSEMNLMDDFVEMEKLAVVSGDKLSRSSHSADEANATTGPLENGPISTEVTGREIISTSDHDPSFSLPSQESKFKLISKLPGWLQDILKVVLEQNHAAQRNPDEILQEIRIALSYINNPLCGEFVDAKKSSFSPGASIPSPVSGNISCISSERALVLDSRSGVADVDESSADKYNQHLLPEFSTSICKIIELIEGIYLPSLQYGAPETLSKKEASYFLHKTVETPSGYTVHTFQWKTSELSDVLRRFLHICYDLLGRKADINKFVQELCSAFNWIINHCFSLQDASSMKDVIKKHFDGNESRSESEAEVAIISQTSGADNLCLPVEQFSTLPVVDASHADHNSSQNVELPSNARQDSKELRNEASDVEAAKKHLEGKPQLANGKSVFLMNKFQESVKGIAESESLIENQVENHKLIVEDLLHETDQKFHFPEAEMKDSKKCCEGSGSACLEQQVQFESERKEIPDSEFKQGDKQLRTEWEITAASEKLAECQETILNLGKQLKALADSKEAARLDKINPTSTQKATATSTSSSTSAAPVAATTALKSTPTKEKVIGQRSSLLDRMIADDIAAPKEPETNGCAGNHASALMLNRSIEPLQKILILNGNKPADNKAVVNPLAIVPSRRPQGGKTLWKKLLWRKRKGKSKKPPLPFDPRQIII